MTSPPPKEGDLRSRYLTLGAIEWEPTKFPGIEIKVLLDDKTSGFATMLFRMAPGAVVPPHEHTGIEQTYVLEGSLEDEKGAVTAGDYVWRPGGSMHVARAPNGAVFISFFSSPNRFFEGQRFFTQDR